MTKTCSGRVIMTRALMFMYQDMVQEVMSLVLSHQSLVHIQLLF